MKTILSLSLASLVSFNAAAQSLPAEDPIQGEKAVPTQIQPPPVAPRILMSQSNGGMYRGISQYAALIEMPDKRIIECSGVKVDFNDYQKNRPADKPLKADVFVTLPEVAYDLRPSPNPQPANVKSFGSCKPYPLPEHIAQSLRDGDTYALNEYMGSPMERALVTLADPTDVNGLLHEDTGTFVVDIHLNSYPKLPKEQPKQPFMDSQKGRFPDDKMKQYKLDMPSCLNTGYNEAVASAVIDGTPLPTTIPLRVCAP